jgi:RNase H-like domain found in reverse transcriptase/Integrase zinc binding domain
LAGDTIGTGRPKIISQSYVRNDIKLPRYQDTQETYAAAKKKYKPVDRKIKPVPGILPEQARVIRKIPEDPLISLPHLSFHPPEFLPTSKLTTERMEEFKLNENTGLLLEEKKLFSHIIQLTEPVWAFDPSERGTMRDDYFSPYIIPLVEHIPWADRNIPIPPGILPQVVTLLREKVAAGVYEPSQASYRSKWFCVLKKSGTLRIVHDLQPLNKVTIKDAGLPPNLDEFVEQFAGHAIYSVFDLFSGYDARTLHPISRDPTSFMTPLGLMRICKLPMGFTNAVAEFQNCTLFILQEEIPHCTNVFIDDVAIKGPKTMYKNSEGEFQVLLQNPGIRRYVWEHAVDVLRILWRMLQAGATFSPSKAQLAQAEATILGQTCSEHGRMPDKARINAIMNWPAPKTVTEVRGFLGLCGTVRIWIKDYSRKARPMTELTRKNVPFIWDERRQISMDILKKAVTSAPALKPIDYNSDQEVILSVDTSHIAIGFILSQKDEEGKKRVARYGSLPINERESRYSQPKLELYGLFRALRHWRLYIIGVKVLIVEMDAKYIKGMLNQPDIQPNAAMNRWIYAILLFDFLLRHVPATEFKGPDGLSRRPPAEEDSVGDNAELAEEWLDTLLDFRIIKHNPYTEGSYTEKWTLNLQSTSLESIKDFLTTLELPKFSTQEEKAKFLSQVKKFYVQDGTLWKRTKRGPKAVIIEAVKQQDLLEKAHDDIGHRGVFGVFSTLSKRFWWPSLKKDVMEFIKTCHQCQIRSTKKVEVPITVSTPATIFTKLYLDVMFMEPAQGYRYIVAARDDLSGAAVGRKLRSIKAKHIAQFLFQEVICHYGHIGQIVTDNGPEVKGAVEELLRRYGIPQIKISAYNSKANGVVERGHFTIREAIMKMCQGKVKDWPNFVDHAFWADRVTTRKATGFSPFYLLHGIDPVLPFDLTEATYLVEGFRRNMSTEELLALRIRQLAKHQEDIDSAASTIAKSRFRSKEQFEKHFRRRIQTQTFSSGDLVLVRNSRVEDELNKKSKPRYLGPYEVVRQTRGGSYVLKELDGTVSRRGVAAFRLLPYHSRNGKPINPNDIMEKHIVPNEDGSSSEDEESEESD